MQPGLDVAAALEAQIAPRSARRRQRFASFGESLPYEASVPAHGPAPGGRVGGAGAEDVKDLERTRMLAPIGHMSNLGPPEGVLADLAVTLHLQLLQFRLASLATSSASTARPSCFYYEKHSGGGGGGGGDNPNGPRALVPGKRFEFHGGFGELRKRQISHVFLLEQELLRETRACRNENLPQILQAPNGSAAFEYSYSILVVDKHQHALLYRNRNSDLCIRPIIPVPKPRITSKVLTKIVSPACESVRTY